MIQPVQLELAPPSLNQAEMAKLAKNNMFPNHSIRVLNSIKKQGVTNPYALALVDVTLGTLICLVEKVKDIALFIIFSPYFLYETFIEKELGEGLLGAVLFPIALVAISIKDLAQHLLFGSIGYELARFTPEMETKCEKTHIELIKAQQQKKEIEKKAKEQKCQIEDKIKSFQSNERVESRLTIANDDYQFFFTQLLALFDMKIDAIKKEDNSTIEKYDSKITACLKLINRLAEKIVNGELEKSSDDYYNAFMLPYKYITFIANNQKRPPSCGFNAYLLLRESERNREKEDLIRYKITGIEFNLDLIAGFQKSINEFREKQKACNSNDYAKYEASIKEYENEIDRLKESIIKYSKKEKL